MKLTTLAICVVLGVPAAAQEIVYATALPRATLGELAARPFAEPAPRVYEHHALPPVRPAFVRGAESERSIAPTATFAPPPVTTLFDADGSRLLLPADAAGAVGPAHVLSMSNARVIVHDRAGKVVRGLTPEQFWASNVPSGSFYDPRAAYDAAADRYVAMAIYDEQAVVFAVTETGNPNGAWRRYRLDVPDADFSMLAVTGDKVIFGTNDYGNDDSVLYTVRKQDLYAAIPSVPMTRHQLGDSYVVPVRSANAGDYVLSSFGNYIRVISLSDPSLSRTIPEPAAWDIAPFAQLRQLSGPFLDGGFGFLEDAVEHDGWIYATMVRDVPDANNQTVTWCRLNLETGQAEWGAVADPEGKAAYAYPSLAVNRYGAMLIGFGTFSNSQYASSGYVYRDPQGRVSNVAPLRAGDSPVLIHERWGDYTTTVVDPVDQTSFWTLQIHAEDGSWATAWARVEIAGNSKRRAARH